MPVLCVNVDHVATVRQARLSSMPDPLEAALLAERAGACGITIHLREDRRHIQDADLRGIKRGISTKLNLEMAASPEIIKIARRARPWQVTFVPEKRRELTTEGGLDVKKGGVELRKVIAGFRKSGIIVSLFIDPDEDQVKASMEAGADAVELNTGAYSEAVTKKAASAELGKLVKAAALTEKLGLTTHAGHGLTCANVGPVAAIHNIEELNIGHSIVARAVMVGFEAAVREMIGAMGRAS
ncbi:MAG: pyridoxine 5'-phosphate synthase [Nitrospinae bacterium]|nr:pyridoxine 5'-phosphate synthase [Nitrospinota bacterium]